MPIETGTRFESPSAVITAFAWSPDGAMLAIASADAHLRVWQLDTGRVWRSHTIDSGSSARQLLWSPDSRKLALIFHSNDDLWIWTLASDQMQRPGISRVQQGAWSRSGQLLAAVLEGDRGLRWEVDTQQQEVVQSTFFHDVTCLQRAPGEEVFAMVSPSAPELRLWTSFSDLRSLPLEAPVTGLACSGDGRMLAVFGEASPRIELINLQQARRTGVLEGHVDRIRGCEFSPDGRLLVSSASDDSLRVWRCDTLELVARHDWPVGDERAVFRLHPTQPLLAALTADRRALQVLDLLPREQAGALPSTVRHVSAKVVLVGEARVGKTCLALRLAEDRYEERESTHGMDFWSLAPERLEARATAPPGERRDVVLWDLGGQEEYRLVHQLFLHDTTLALVLFDPLQGRAAFEAVEAWNSRFEKQLHGRSVVKLLVGTKQDVDSPLDRLGVEALIKKCGFAGYFPTSARSGRGLCELRKAISRAIDWPALATTSRPDLFQRIQDEVEVHRERGEIVLPMVDLERAIREQRAGEFDPRAVAAVVQQLALQGVIALTRLSTGDQVLVLQLEQVERYAGSLILAARDNPLGAPAIEQALLTRRDWELPRLPFEQRLPLREERWVLECVVELLLEHGLCIRHEGLLVFPALFRTTESLGTHVPRSTAASYEVLGAVDNIYSSLVAAVALSQRFGRMRLWADRAEFEEAGRGVAGLHRVERSEGATRLEVYFDDRLSEETRGLFARFVDEQLLRQGVRLSSQSPVVPAGGGGGQVLKTQSILEQLEKQRQGDVEKTKSLFSAPGDSARPGAPLRVLHLSDLHVRADADVDALLQPLVADLRDTREGLGLRALDYLVISGDLTERALPEEFEQARRFVSGLIEKLGLTAQRCIIVPGNHDLSWDEEHLYHFRMKRQVRPGQLQPGSYVEKEDWLLIRDEERYPLRFQNFSKFFYHPLMQQEFPRPYQEQGLVSTFPESGLQFLAFNSAWEIDEHFPRRASLHAGAVSRALLRADEQLEQVRATGKLPSERSLLRLAVWHHPITGGDMMADVSFGERLRQADVRLCLHGHVHEERADVLHHLHPSRRMHVLGTGSFGAPAHDRPESTPRLYNVLEIARTHDTVRVHTRCRRKQDGAWEGWAIWPGASAGERRTYYEVALAR
ncbi:MAG TPA: metallophosphoesterase [Myxococcaceae bacterium]|nr:metallophosphoesterase [Myxococcaceae bacterium]